MKIDLNGADASNLSSVTSTQRGAAESAAAAIVADAQIGEDQATLSSDSASISNLTAKAMQSPEVREDRIEALRQAIQNGSYQIDPKKIAEAMVRQSE